MSSPPRIDLSPGQDEQMRSKAHQLCSEHLNGPWAEISADQLSLLPISGGMSNSLFCCSLPDSINVPDDEPRQVLLRLYGDQSRSDADIQLEIFNLLSLKSLGPKLYGKFEEGRIEEFLPANPLTCNELINDDISSIIARKLAVVHSLDVPMPRDNNWILDRFNEWLGFIKENSDHEHFSGDLRPSTKEIARELLSIDFDPEIKFMQDIFVRTQSPIVFSHNDLHQGNILLAKGSKRRTNLEDRVILIDFEYCSYNYRAYDIANHFCEWCFEYDTSDYPHFNVFQERFPSDESQLNFISNYLERRRQIDSSPQSQRKKINGSERSCHLNGGSDYGTQANGRCSNGIGRQKLSEDDNNNNCNDSYDNNEVDAREEERVLSKEVRPFFMAANLLWTLWCIRSAQYSSIKFGYWEHAMARWKLYSSLKAAYISKEGYDGL